MKSIFIPDHIPSFFDMSKLLLNPNYLSLYQAKIFTGTSPFSRQITKVLFYSLLQTQEHTFEWSNHDRRMVLSAYHWLSWLMLLPKSVLAQKYGSKKVIGYMFCTSAVMSSSIPFLAKFGVNIIIYVRVLQGLLSVNMVFSNQ